MRMSVAGLESWFRKLPRDRPLLGLIAGGAFFVLASFLRWILGGMSEGFGPMTFLPAILLAGLVRRNPYRPRGRSPLHDGRVGDVLPALRDVHAGQCAADHHGHLRLHGGARALRHPHAATSQSMTSRNPANDRTPCFGSCSTGLRTTSSSSPSFLWLRRKSLPAGSAGADALDAARARLDMMSRVHRRLHDPSSVDQPIGDYLRALCMDLIQTSDTPGVHLAVRAEPVTFNLETLMSVSLIVAELVTNSLKHAFQGRDDGEIRITVSLAGGHHTVMVADDGPGIPYEAVSRRKRAIGTGHSRQPGPPIAGSNLLRSGRRARW